MGQGPQAEGPMTIKFGADFRSNEKPLIIFEPGNDRPNNYNSVTGNLEKFI